MQTIDVDGVEIAYFESGTGPLVLLLHGFPDTAHTWADLRPRLVDAGYRTVAPFMRGYAPSEIFADDTDYTVVTLGGDVVGLIEALGEEQTIVIAHDWGASAAYAAANLAPERIARMVTLSIPHPLAYVGFPDALDASPHFATLAEPDAGIAVAADDFARIDELVAVWSPDWDVPAGELEPVKNAFTFPGSLDGALGYYRAFATAPLDPVLFQQTTVRTLSFSGSNDGAGTQEPFADQANGFAMPVEVITLPTGHVIPRGPRRGRRGGARVPREPLNAVRPYRAGLAAMRTLAPREIEPVLAGGDFDVVDVREPHEWATGHIPGARLVPLAELRSDPRGKLVGDKVILVCARGARSSTAGKLAEQAGIADVVSLEGGTQAWQAAGLPIEAPPAV